MGAVKEESSPHPLLEGRSAWMKVELWSLGGDHSNQSEEGKSESDLSRRLGPLPGTLQAESLVCQWRWGLDAEAPDLGVRPGKRTMVGSAETA